MINCHALLEGTINLPFREWSQFERELYRVPESDFRYMEDAIRRTNQYWFTQLSPGSLLLLDLYGKTKDDFFFWAKRFSGLTNVSLDHVDQSQLLLDYLIDRVRIPPPKEHETSWLTHRMHYDSIVRQYTPAIAIGRGKNTQTAIVVLLLTDRTISTKHIWADREIRHILHMLSPLEHRSRGFNDVPDIVERAAQLFGAWDDIIAPQVLLPLAIHMVLEDKFGLRRSGQFRDAAEYRRRMTSFVGPII